MVQSMDEKAPALELVAREKTEKLSEERARRLQDKTVRRVKMQEKLGKDMQAARQAPEEFQEKRRENKKELGQSRGAGA